MKNDLVVKHNVLINASYRLGLVEQRLLLLSIVAIRRYALEVSESTKITVTASDYMERFGVARQVAYQALKDGVQGIFGREFGYKELTDKGERVVRSHWVSKIAYIDNAASVELYFTPDVISRVRELESHFTSYELEQVAGLNSKYAVRLYEIVIAWRSKGQTNQISMQELRDRLGLLDDEYTAIHNFKARVLQSSIDEINEKTDINLTYEQHKQGRKIVGFTFTIKQKSKPKQRKKDEQRDDNTLDMLAPIKMTDKQRLMFASKLANMSELGSRAPVGATMQEFADKIANDLLDSDKAEFYRPYLEKAGCKF
ncbi:hypothetical protein B0181_10215 [Moraxella caviae]|uniref:Replication protein n=1 Tax=Moraxella caviae TaxID=34060 RepID=A0A1S9ZVG6_9GAMM|nr:replication initiation protein RepM [Moraxella caviae]OOR87522.1 hypothetical protein B0181_10215 [Moraxella caviae]STZ14959.1 replication protein [Moraxella caviae]